MQYNNLTFIGMPGSGKSSLCQSLSIDYNLPLYDIDKMIVLQEKKSIQEIFEEKGQAYFRYLELSTFLKVLLNEEKGLKIICPGAGIVESICNNLVNLGEYKNQLLTDYPFLQNENIEDYLKTKAFFIYINVDVNTICAFNNYSHRPLLRSKEDLQVIYNRRKNFYEKLADINFIFSFESYYMFKDSLKEIFIK